MQRPFDLDGVYSEVNPMMASIYPATLMWLFGTGQFTWKFSLIVSVTFAIPGIYILGHLLAGRAAATISAATLAFSHYIFAFMHTGYPNTDVLPIIVWSVVLFVLGIRRRDPLLIYASGVLAGFGLLFNIVARAVLPIIALYAISHRDTRRHLLSYWPWALGLSLTALPVLLVNGTDIYSTTLVKIVGPASQHASEYDSVVSRITSNAMQNLMAFNYNPHTSHYVSGALLDPISTVLAALGFGCLIATAGRSLSRLVLIIQTVLAIGAALLSPYPNVPITRMTSLLIPLSLMAGVAAAYVYRECAASTGWTGCSRGRLPAVMVVGTLCTAVLLLNVRQFWVETPRKFFHTQEAVAMGALSSEQCAGDAASVAMVGRGTASLLAPAVYSYSGDGDSPILLDHSEILSGMPMPERVFRCAIFYHPHDSEIIPFMLDIAARYPDGQFRRFSNPSGMASVEIFSRGQ